MASVLPQDQLFDLCAREGATPKNIRERAPFLETLPATQHALSLLPVEGWGEAARALLICVTRPGGAGGFDERISLFVVTCLALDGSIAPLGQRLDNLIERRIENYPTSRNTWTKMRQVAMTKLAVSLQTLQEYPCGSEDSLRGIARLIAANAALIRKHMAPKLSKDEVLQLHQLVFEELPRVNEYFESIRIAPTAYVKKLQWVISAISRGAYARLYEDLGPSAAEILVPPRYVTSFFGDVLGSYDPDAEEIQLMVRAISVIMLDTEGHDLWREAFHRERRSESLSPGMLEQRRRIASYFESWMFAKPSMV